MGLLDVSRWFRSPDRNLIPFYAVPRPRLLLFPVGGLEPARDGLYPDDFDDQDPDNYDYDGTGNLIRDEQADADIEWTPYGKVSLVDRGTIDQKVHFGYGPDQNRVMKAVVDVSATDTIFSYYIRDVQGNVMALYERQEDTVVWREQYLYGSNRLGLMESDVRWYPGDGHIDSAYHVINPVLYEGCKRYEIANHLGNVMTVVSDRREAIDSTANSEADYYEAVVLTANDYYPFGQEMPGRTYNIGDYRYGFNGKEKDQNDEWGDLTHYDYGFRIYNPAIGRFLSVDPLAEKYASVSPYAYVANNPLVFIDPDGRELVLPSILTRFGQDVQRDLNLIYRSPLGRSLIRDLEVSKTKVLHHDAGRLLYTDYYDVTNSMTKGDYPNYWEAKDGVITVQYAQRANVSVDGIPAYSFLVLAHEYVHARDIDTGILENLYDQMKAAGVEIPQERIPNELAETRALIFTNSLRKEQGIDGVRTHYRGERLVEDDGVTPVVDYGVDITQGLFDTESEQNDK